MTSILTIITAYNSEQTIERAVESVLEQDLPDNISLKLIVVDDFSNDKTSEILTNRYQDIDKVSIIQRKVNAGFPSIPRNEGLRFALKHEIYFDFLCYLDADDYWLPSKIKEQLTQFEQRPELSLSYCGHLIVEDESGQQYQLPRRKIQKIWQHFLWSHITLSSIMLNWEKVKELQPLFNESPDFKAIEDFDLSTRILLRNGQTSRTESGNVVYYKSKHSISRGAKKEIIKRLNFLFSYSIKSYELNPFLYRLILSIKKIKIALFGVY